jgi:hypothetical protein
MNSNLTMKHYINPVTGDKYWIRHEDSPQEGWVELEQPTEMPLPDPNYIPPYTARRINQYPLVTDQLDMLWHAMDKDEIPGKGSTWYNTILEVKNQHPKV